MRSMHMTTSLTLLVSLSLLFLSACAGPARMDSTAMAAQGGILRDSEWNSIPDNLGFIQKGNASAVAAGNKLRLVTELYNTQIDILENDKIDVVSTYFGSMSSDKSKNIYRITFHTAFFQYVTREEDEIAAMIAHQLAHITLGHVRGPTTMELTAGLTSGIAMGIVSSIVPFSDVLFKATVSRAGDPGLMAREEEADRLGFSYLVQTGYSGQAMLSMWEKVRKAEAKNSLFFSRQIGNALGFRDEHPANKSRYKYLKELALGTGDGVQE
jgi:hypothetical protein